MANSTFIQQRFNSDCAVACLAMFLAHWTEPPMTAGRQDVGREMSVLDSLKLANQCRDMRFSGSDIFERAIAEITSLRGALAAARQAGREEMREEAALQARDVCDAYRYHYKVRALRDEIVAQVRALPSHRDGETGREGGE